jgi:hypothetical protein
MFVWEINDRRLDLKLCRFSAVCKAVGLSDKLDLPRVMKVSRKMNGMQRKIVVIVK